MARERGVTELILTRVGDGIFVINSLGRVGTTIALFFGNRYRPL